MAANPKQDSQKQETAFAHEDSRDGIGLTNENVALSNILPSEQNMQVKTLHSSFTSKSPAPLMFTHNDLQRNVQQLVDDINAKRKRDSDSLSEVRKALEMQLNSSGNILEETLVGIYEENSKGIQEKLQEIFAALDRICRLLGGRFPFL